MTEPRLATTAFTSPSEHDPTRQRILAAAKANLRRFGVNKVTVVDIARDLGMSHSNVYRFFRTKTEILNAVVDEWLSEEDVLLGELSGGSGPAGERLERLMLALLARKRMKREADAELNVLYYHILAERPAALARYDATVFAAFERIIADGVRNGEFAIRDVPTAVRIVRSATGVFFDPQYAHRTGEQPERGARDVIRTLVAGFANREHPPALGTEATTTPSDQ